MNEHGKSFRVLTQQAECVILNWKHLNNDLIHESCESYGCVVMRQISLPHNVLLLNPTLFSYNSIYLITLLLFGIFFIRAFA